MKLNPEKEIDFEGLLEIYNYFIIEDFEKRVREKDFFKSFSLGKTK